jgi:hypothetical protein
VRIVYDPRELPGVTTVRPEVAGVLLQPQWCPSGLTKTQCRQMQKFRVQEMKEQEEEEERDKWFNQVRPMIESAKTSKEKRIEKEERDDGSDSDGTSMVERSQRNIKVNMVFDFPAEFSLPEAEVARLELGEGRAVLKKPSKLGKHVRPLYIRGYLDEAPTNRMLVDGGACVNIMPHSIF